MSQLRILAIGEGNSGVTYHRLALPVYTMKKDYAMITNVINEQTLQEKKFNIVIINRFYAHEHIQKVLYWKKKYGFKLVVDIDDYWELNNQHLLAPSWRKFNVSGTIQAYIRNADLVTCTHQRLYYEVIKLNKNCVILPNALPFDKDQFISNRINHEFVNFVHTGSISHFSDVKQIKNDMEELSKSKAFKEASQIVMCGWNDENAFHWKQMADVLTAKQKLQYQILMQLPVDSYMNFYNEADVLIVPLLDNKFNRMKSNLKALEAGAKQIPIMTYKKAPYDDIPTCFWVEDWEKDMKRMAFSKQMREDYGMKNAEYVRKHYDLFKINEEREAIYNKLIAQ